MEYKIINGKFWRDGKIEPLEFGNLDQIKLMNKELKYLKSFEEDGHKPTIYDCEKYIINFNFKCPKCSQRINYESEYDDIDHYYEEVQYEGVTCKKCRTRFKFSLDTYHDLTVKYGE